MFFRSEKIKDALREYIIRQTGIPDDVRYSYMVVNKREPSEKMIISSYPEEWVRLYYDGNLQLTDPVVLTAFSRTSPFTWDDNMVLISGLKPAALFSKARKYDIVRGVTFVLHDHRNHLALLSFITTSPPGLSQEPPFLSDTEKRQMQLIHIHAEMYRLARCVSDSDAQNGIRVRKTLFTPREHDVLYWSALGKTYGETGTILGISVSTVKFHMRNIIARLGVSNARQAIRLSTELELLTLKPSSASP
jgi:LuxR family quorum-sensing system transcriptional regulator ExpR